MTAAVLGATAPAIPALTRWGLSPSADLVYRTLVVFGPQTCGQASQDLGLAARQIRQALDELAAVGAVQPMIRPGADATRPANWEWVALPAQRVLMLVDIVFPGWVPFACIFAFPIGLLALLARNRYTVTIEFDDLPHGGSVMRAYGRARRPVRKAFADLHS